MASRHALALLISLALTTACSTEAGPHPDDSYERVMTDWAAEFAAIPPVVAEVRDRASWDRARPRLEAILQELSNISERSNFLPAPAPDQVRALDEQMAEQVAVPLAELKAARAALPTDIDRLFVLEVLTKMTPPGAPGAVSGPFIYTIF